MRTGWSSTRRLRGAGVVFVRGDIDPPLAIPVGMELHVDGVNRTNLSAGGATVEMVEHVLIALAALDGE